MNENDLRRDSSAFVYNIFMNLTDLMIFIHTDIFMQIIKIKLTL